MAKHDFCRLPNAELKQIGKLNTTIGYFDDENGRNTVVQYYSTQVVIFNDKFITLNTGGHESSSTKRRMNQTSSQFGLFFEVFQKNRDWFVRFKGKVIPFGGDTVTFNRSGD